MARERVKGAERSGGTEHPAPEPKAEGGQAGGADGNSKPPRPAYCRVYARKRLASAMPALVAKLLEEAGNGSLAHLKVLVQLSGLDTGEVVPRKKVRQRSLESVLQERWEQDRVEQEADRLRDRAAEDGAARRWGDGLDDGRMDEGF